MGQLELELDEERNNSDVLSERISRCREQVVDQSKTKFVCCSAGKNKNAFG